MEFDEIMNYDAPKNEGVFEELSAMCGHRKIVPYVGAGLSAFEFPLWDKFIRDLYKKYRNDKMPDDLMVAAGLIEEELGKDNFRKILKKTFGVNRTTADWEEILNKAKSEAVSVIPKLFSAPIITTNFDQILEHIHKDIHDFDVALPKNLEEKITQARQERKRLLYKIHGCVFDDDENIVIAKNDYKKAYEENLDFIKSLENFFLGFHFLFLGCSLEKDKPIELWDSLKKRNVMRHYAILDCKKEKIEERRKELEDMGIYPILFESGEFKSVKIILDKLLSEKKANSKKAKELLDSENELLKILVKNTSDNDMEAIKKDKELTSEAKKFFGNISKNALLKYNKNRR